MKRFFSFCAALTASLALTGCIPNEMSIELLHAVQPDESCVADPGGTPTANGFLDVGATNARLAQAFVARNNMEGNTDTSSQRLNSRDFVAERAVVSYSAVEQDIRATMEGLGERETPMAVTIEAEDLSGIWVDVLPRDVATVLAADALLNDPLGRATIIVNTRIEGHTLDGALLSSSTLAFPVEVCNRCRFCADGSEPFWSCTEGQTPAVCVP